jgi:tetratricopeptide (TPR) repeat protein
MAFPYILATLGPALTKPGSKVISKYTMRAKGIFTAVPFFLLCTSGIRAQPSLNNTPIEQARALAAAGQLGQANQILAELVRVHPEDLRAWQELGALQLQQRLNDDAMSSFETVLKAHPDSSVALDGETRAAVACALADRSAGNQDRALACLVRGRKYVPKSTELMLDFGIMADAMQIYKDADNALLEAHTLDPENPRILYALAHVELDEQKTADAEANLRAYLKMRPDDATAHYGLGHLLYMLSRDEDAKGELEKSIALQPQQTESYYELGQIALDAHDQATAEQDYGKVLAVAPNHGGALTGMGVLAYRAKDYPSAYKYLKQAVLYAPDYVTAHQYYAMTLARLGQDEESRQESARARELTEQQNKLRHGYTLRNIQ